MAADKKNRDALWNFTLESSEELYARQGEMNPILQDYINDTKNFLENAKAKLEKIEEFLLEQQEDHQAVSKYMEQRSRVYKDMVDYSINSPGKGPPDKTLKRPYIATHEDKAQRGAKRRK